MSHSRGESERSPDVQRLVRVVGKAALAALGLDSQGTQAESWRIRWLIAEWVLDRVERPGGTRFDTAREIYDQAAYYAKCANLTADHWIHVFTVPASPWKLWKDVTGWYLMPRARETDNGGNGGEAHS